MYYSHSYEDPDTGQLVDVMVEDGYDEYRNAVRDHRSQGSGIPAARPYMPPPRMPGQATRPPGGMFGGIVPPRQVVVRDPGPPQIVPPRPPARPTSARPIGFEHGEYLTIKKSAIAEILPSLGHLWAAFLGMPQAPQAVGEDKTDRDNAAMHRDALARHQQNQTRILALTDLASRAVKLFAS
jgi:hypothetical protein